MQTMHQIWSIPELVDAIVSEIPPLDFWLSFVDDDCRAARHNLAVLARTARLFFVPASKLLWYNVDAEVLNVVIKALHGQRVPGQNPAYLADRFGFFEKLIHQIELGFDSPGLPYLAASYTSMVALKDNGLSGPTLPNLVVLNIDAILMSEDKKNPHDAEYCALAGCTLATLWLVPTLEVIEITTSLNDMNFIKPEMTSFFQSIPQRCPRLRKLTFFDMSPNHRPESDESYMAFLLDMETMVLSLPLLETFALPWPTSPNLLQALSTHPSLLELRIDAEMHPSGEQIFSQDTCASENHFNHLRRLGISGSGLTAIHSFFPHSDNNAGPTASFNNLEAVSIVLCSADNNTNQLFNLSSIVARLPRPARQLKKLHLVLDLDTSITDSEILLLASSVPSLEHVWLRDSVVEDEKEVTSLTMRSLVHLAIHCRSLCFFRAHFLDLRSVAIPNTLTSSEQAIAFELSSSAPIFSSEIRIFIRRLWPAATVHLRGQPTIDDYRTIARA